MTDTEQIKPKLSVELPITVKTYDIDFANIVHNMVYIRWLEDLRLALLVPYLPIEKLLAEGMGPILDHTEIWYKRAVRYGDPVMGRMSLSNVGRVRWEVTGEFWVNEQLCCKAVQTGFLINLQTFKPVRMPALLRQFSTAEFA